MKTSRSCLFIVLSYCMSLSIPPTATFMCKLVLQKHRCGVDTVKETRYCQVALRNQETGEDIGCDSFSWKSPDGICSEPCHVVTCYFCRYGWKWRCCHCGKGPNEEQLCGFKDAGRTCEHKVCDFCVPTRYCSTRRSGFLSPPWLPIRQQFIER